MAKLIDVKNIDETDFDDLKAKELVDIPWRKYLEIQNYNKDPEEMCRLCIEKQKKENNGRIVIECKGLNSADYQLRKQFDDDVVDEMLSNLNEEERDILEGAFSPTAWFRTNVKNPEKYGERWYQHLILSCSARNKVLRLGRRCGKTFSVAMLLTYMIARSEKPLNILVAAPQLTMIEEIEKTFIGISDSLIQEDFITRKKKTPALEITFFNGSLLQGITTGTDGTAARGKKADIIWLDETDFIPREALNAIQAIKLDNPNVRVIMTSTPKGEGNLYKEAQQSNVKEFHYPSYVIPHYNDSLHEGFKKDFNEIVFSQEILALYGLDEAGVFQPHHIQDSYEYYRESEYTVENVLANRQNYTVLIGVDWNHDQNGTRIVITAYDKMTNRFFIVEKKRIAKLNLTQEIAVNMVVELNRKYNADHIVCDEGFGIGQVSELRVRGKEQFGKVPPTHPDIKLVQTESVQFGASLTIRDPVTSETLKKNTKQYIVELTQKYLEEGRLALSENKDEELIEQMKNYAVYSKSLRGVVYKPKDKSIGDHDLDAFMLTLFMFDKVYGDYIAPKAVEGVGIVRAQDNIFKPPRSMSKASNPRTGRRTSGFTSPRKSYTGFKSRQKW